MNRQKYKMFYTSRNFSHEELVKKREKLDCTIEEIKDIKTMIFKGSLKKDVCKKYAIGLPQLNEILAMNI